MRRVAVALLLLAAVTATACTRGGGAARSPDASSPGTHASSKPTPKPDRWTGSIVSTSYHRLYVGGTCTTDWSTELSFDVAKDGTVDGTGTARLTSKGKPCPFAVAQLEIEVFHLAVTGTVRGGNVRLLLSESSHRPSSGATDLGGFRATVLVGGTTSELLVPFDPKGPTASARLSIAVPGPDRDEFGSTNVVRLRCKNCG